MTAPQQAKYAIRIFGYGPSSFEEKELASVAEIKEHLGRHSVIWVDIEGTMDAESLAEVGSMFELHQLALEDVLNTHQRSKVEQYGQHHFIVTRMVSIDRQLETEQLSIFFGKDFVLTFQSKLDGDCLNPVRDRIRKAVGKIREENSDHLAYALVDAVVDGYFPVLNVLGERLNTLEEEVLFKHDPRFPTRIHAVKRDIWRLRQTIWPLRDTLNTLVRDASHMVSKETRFHLRDCYDHAVRIIDLVETYRELCSDLMDLQLNRESSRMNEILKVLTIISTLFIPPTLVAGIYGMNFRNANAPLNMPELDWYYGYPFAIAVMVLMMAGLWFWLWYKGWLTGPTRRWSLFRRRRDDRDEADGR